MVLHEGNGELIIRGDIDSSSPRKFQCWICSKDKDGTVKLHVDDITTNEHYDVCVECFEKMATFCTMFIKLRFESTIHDLKMVDNEWECC